MSEVSKVHHTESNTFNGMHVGGVKRDKYMHSIDSSQSYTSHKPVGVYMKQNFLELYTFWKIIQYSDHISPATFHQDLC